MTSFPGIHCVVFICYFLTLVYGSPRRSDNDGTSCPPFNKGDFTIHQYQLYPENAFWDSQNCVVYFSALFNGSVAVYDPYKDETIRIITFPNITYVPGQHASGLDYSSKSGLLSVVLNSETPFLTGGANVSGDNWLVKYDPVCNRELWRTNLTAVTEGRFGGFQDVSVDTKSNSYVIGTYPKSILKVDKHGLNAEVWYPPQSTNTAIRGYTGVAALEDVLLVVNTEEVPASNPSKSEIYRFDMTEPEGRPVLVERTPNLPIGVANRIHLPVAYGGRVMLVSEQLLGVTVLRSVDGSWKTAEHLGSIRSNWPIPFDRILPTTVQVGPRNQYMVGQHFPGDIVPGTTAGNRSEWEMFDITAMVEELLRA
ncbi:hypothetical protein MFIFM68171_08014 [Madurella fahalii]|uniref:Uncharacterized protein n=1 Tax=Madurella fahalii TaxID=1157608 RepID=A0ABQ0GJD8_9PEZI